LWVGVACNGGYVMIIELTTPKDMRDAIEQLFHCQQTTNESIAKITLALEQLSVWLKMQESINFHIDERINQLERKTDLIMKATRFSLSSASSK